MHPLSSSKCTPTRPRKHVHEAEVEFWGAVVRLSATYTSMGKTSCMLFRLVPGDIPKRMPDNSTIKWGSGAR